MSENSDGRMDVGDADAMAEAPPITQDNPPTFAPGPTGDSNTGENDTIKLMLVNKSNGWQIAPKGRTNQAKRKRTNSVDSLQSPIESNRFFPLTTIPQEENSTHDQASNSQANTQKVNTTKIPKPPPIFIPGVQAIHILAEKIQQSTQGDKYTYKTVGNDGQIRIMANTIEDYRKIIRVLKAECAMYHTYQLKQERAYRVVIRSLHPSIPLDDIKSALENKGHQVRNVSHIYRKGTREPLPLFFVDLEPNSNNKEIYKIDLLLNAKIQIEPPKKNATIVQCTRCQMYDHSKTYCNRPFRCVKCGKDHDSKNCTKSKDTPAKCALCEGPHTANYKGCSEYKRILEKRKQNQQKPHWHRSISQQRSTNTRNVPNNSPQMLPQTNTTPPVQVDVRPSPTYASVTRNDIQSNEQQTELSRVIENSFKEFQSILKQQTQLLNTMLNLLTVLTQSLTSQK